jgi:hypothetical protein
LICFNFPKQLKRLKTLGKMNFFSAVLCQSTGTAIQSRFLNCPTMYGYFLPEQRFIHNRDQFFTVTQPLTLRFSSQFLYSRALCYESFDSCSIEDCASADANLRFLEFEIF